MNYGLQMVNQHQAYDVTWLSASVDILWKELGEMRQNMECTWSQQHNENSKYPVTASRKKNWLENYLHCTSKQSLTIKGALGIF